MDLETKALLNEVKSALGEATAVKGAVAQLEEQMKAIPKTIESKLASIRAATYDGRGRYRGAFGSEDHARSFGLFALSQCEGKSWARDALKSEFPDVAKAFGTSDAGNLIPTEYSGTIIDLIEKYGVFQRNAMRVPMSTDIQKFSKKTARLAAAPMSESTALSAVKPTLSDKSLTARKWGAYVEIPSEVSDDAVTAIAEMIATNMAQAFALAIDTAGFLGDGTAAYNNITGVANALIANAIVTLAAGKTAWSDITKDDFLKLVSLPVNQTTTGNDARWYCSHQFYWTVIAPIILAAGGATAAEFEGRRSLQFLGYPVELTQVMPTASAAGKLSVIFGNLRLGAAFGDRRQLTVKQSTDFRFSEDMLALLGTARLDIQVYGAGNGTTVEVLTGLATAAT